MSPGAAKGFGFGFGLGWVWFKTDRDTGARSAGFWDCTPWVQVDYEGLEGRGEVR